MILVLRPILDGYSPNPVAIRILLWFDSRSWIGMEVWNSDSNHFHWNNSKKAWPKFRSIADKVDPPPSVAIDSMGWDDATTHRLKTSKILNILSFSMAFWKVLRASFPKSNCCPLQFCADFFHTFAKRVLSYVMPRKFKQKGQSNKMRIFLLSKELLETWEARLIIQVAVFGSSCMHGTCAAIERMSYFWRETWHFSTKILVVTFETLPKIIWQREHNDFPLIYCSVITILQKINHFYHCLNQLLNIWKFITQLNLTIMTILDRCLTPKRSYKNSDNSRGYSAKIAS